MLVENSRVSLLSNDDRQVLESWIVDFDRHWHEGRLATQLDEIPPDSSLRLPALAEMVKIDLERRWRSGPQISLESYLGQFPELGGPGNVSADLILAGTRSAASSGSQSRWRTISGDFRTRHQNSAD